MTEHAVCCLVVLVNRCSQCYEVAEESMKRDRLYLRQYPLILVMGSDPEPDEYVGILGA